MAEEPLLLFPPFFGGKLLEPNVLMVILPSIISFSLAASSGYIVNDIMDRESDRCHSTKKNRPIARGDISVLLACMVAVFLCATAIIVSSLVSRELEGILIIYFITSFLYSLYFKYVVIVDIFVIAFGFLLRVMAGGVAFHVTISGWLFLTVFLVALFLSAGKRLGELIVLHEAASNHRSSLKYYSRSFLEGILWFAASAALVTYALYIIEKRESMLYTVPVATYGLFRYIYIVKEGREGRGDPTEILLKDEHIIVTGIVWVAMIGTILYK